MSWREEVKEASKAFLIGTVGKNFKRQKRNGLWSKSYASEALGVHPDQVTEARDRLRRCGVSVDFDKGGRAIITSNKHFKDVARASGLYNGKDGYEARNEDGFKVGSGRGPVRERERLKKMIEEWN